VKKAFTLIEMIMVIVILGIIGVITTDIIGAIYRSYNNQLVVNDLTLKTSNALNIISKRLDRSIKESIAYDDDYKAIQQKSRSVDRNDTGALLWIGQDVESFKLSGDLSQNGYSGFIAVPSSNGIEMNATNSNAGTIQSVELNITGTPSWEANITTALYFPYASEDENVSGMFYEYEANKKPSALFPVSTMQQNEDNNSNMDINLSRPPETIVERFALTYSAYALKQENGNLTLYYNFRPWQDEDYNDGNETTLLNNVHSFEYWSEGQGSVIRLRVCVQNNRYIGAGDESITFCKESAIVR